jgi:hypothetical protein
MADITQSDDGETLKVRLQMDRTDRLAIEERLKAALGEAKAAYEFAKKEQSAYEFAQKEQSEAMNFRQDVGVLHSDGNLRLVQSLKTHRAALRDYTDALIKFNRFILDRKLPGESD